MEQRLSLITLGVRDVSRAQRSTRRSGGALVGAPTTTPTTSPSSRPAGSSLRFGTAPSSHRTAASRTGAAGEG